MKKKDIEARARRDNQSSYRSGYPRRVISGGRERLQHCSPGQPEEATPAVVVCSQIGAVTPVTHINGSAAALTRGSRLAPRPPIWHSPIDSLSQHCCRTLPVRLTRSKEEGPDSNPTALGLRSIRRIPFPTVFCRRTLANGSPSCAGIRPRQNPLTCRFLGRKLFINATHAQ